MSLKFRKILSEQILQIRSLVNTIGCESFGSDTASFLKTMEELNSHNVYQLFVIKEDNVILGFIILSVVGAEAEILQIAIAKGSRRKGAGTFLMNNILNWCSRNEVRSMYLEVRTSNRGAIAFYEKSGFEVIGKRKNYYDDPIEDALIMTRRICGKDSEIHL